MQIENFENGNVIPLGSKELNLQLLESLEIKKGEAIEEGNDVLAKELEEKISYLKSHN